MKAEWGVGEVEQKRLKMMDDIIEEEIYITQAQVVTEFVFGTCKSSENHGINDLKNPHREIFTKKNPYVQEKYIFRSYIFVHTNKYTHTHTLHTHI